MKSMPPAEAIPLGSENGACPHCLKAPEGNAFAMRLIDPTEGMAGKELEDEIPF